VCKPYQLIKQLTTIHSVNFDWYLALYFVSIKELMILVFNKGTLNLIGFYLTELCQNNSHDVLLGGNVFWLICWTGFFNHINKSCIPYFCHFVIWYILVSTRPGLLSCKTQRYGQSIRRSAAEQSKLLDSIGTALMDRDHSLEF
jgi:hypothetical protein